MEIIMLQTPKEMNTPMKLTGVLETLNFEK